MSIITLLRYNRCDIDRYIHRYYGFSPVEATANQWYEYHFDMPPVGRTWEIRDL